MTKFVGAHHEFHDPAFVQEWSKRFLPTAPRIALFDLILEQVRQLEIPGANVWDLYT